MSLIDYLWTVIRSSVLVMSLVSISPLERRYFKLSVCPLRVSRYYTCGVFVGSWLLPVLTSSWDRRNGEPTLLRLCTRIVKGSPMVIFIQGQRMSPLDEEFPGMEGKEAKE